MGFRLWLAIALNLGIASAELIGGFLGGSIALLADSVHNFGDVGTLTLAAVARNLGARPPSLRHTYGFKRFEVFAALINVIVLAAATALLLRESLFRLLHPARINSTLTIVVACVAFGANSLSILLLRVHEKHDLNLRAAVLHLMQDAVSSVVVIAVGFLSNTRVGHYADSLAAVAIGGAILFGVGSILRQVMRTLLEGAPVHIDVAELVRRSELHFNIRFHHVHVWEVGPGQCALTAHLLVRDMKVREAEELCGEVRDFLRENWGIQHVTLEPEVMGCGSEEVLGTWNTETVTAD
jgi:cobalt-zinc-cadmium efflux system protein